MKFKLLFVTVAGPLVALSQTSNFTVTGKIGHLNKPAKIYFDYMFNDRMVEDSADLVDGGFSFSGRINKRATSRIVLSRDGGGKGMEIYGKSTGDIFYWNFGEENISLNAPDSIHNVKVTGSKVYDEMLAFHKATGGTVMEIHRLANLRVEQLKKKNPDDTIGYKKVVAWVDSSTAIRLRKMEVWVRAHPSDYFSLESLNELIGLRIISPEDGSKIFNSMSEELRLSFAGQNLYQLLSADNRTRAGAKAPGFIQPDVNGKPVSLSDYKGKWVLVEFWASWCIPCRGEAPNLIKAYKEYHNKGFDILSVSVDHEKDKWLGAIEKDGLTWTQVSDLKGWNNGARVLYGIAGVPANFLVGPDGKVIAGYLRGEELNKKLKEIFDGK